MSLSRAFASAGAVVALASFACVAGCSSSSDGPAEKEAVESYESELRLAQPRYRAFGFWAKGGDEITADVKSLNGDAMGWITTSSYDVVAANDDASYSTLDSKVVYTVPAGTASRAYRIVFRDYDLLDATFTVKLSINSAAATCDYGDTTYQEGDGFPSTDGCNACSCGPSGVACTKRACLACDPDNEPWRNYVGTPTSCQVIRYVCTATQRSFSNTCGCGCEELSH